MSTDDNRFGPTLRRLREERGLSLRELGRLAHRSKSHLHEVETGRKNPTSELARQLDDLLDSGGQLAGFLLRPPAPDSDEHEAWELERQLEISDVSSGTVDRIERAVDDLASAYAGTPPADLLVRVRARLDYTTRLLDARATLATRRRLFIASGWLALLRATLHVDLRDPAAATAWLETAATLAAHAEHREIQAWCLETKAWEALTGGHYRRALVLSDQAQQVAPRGSSAHLQAVAQEGRAWARVGDQRRTRQALDRLHRLVEPLDDPERPEHHYRYDPHKAAAYTATTLAWAGDPAALAYTRTILKELDPLGDGGQRPRRVASARLDLALALATAGEADEAASAATKAITSGRIVPSNWWRATEVMSAVDRLGCAAADDLREVYESFRPRPLAHGR